MGASRRSRDSDERAKRTEHKRQPDTIAELEQQIGVNEGERAPRRRPSGADEGQRPDEAPMGRRESFNGLREGEGLRRHFNTVSAEGDCLAITLSHKTGPPTGEPFRRKESREDGKHHQRVPRVGGFGLGGRPLLELRDIARQRRESIQIQ